MKRQKDMIKTVNYLEGVNVGMVKEWDKYPDSSKLGFLTYMLHSYCPVTIGGSPQNIRQYTRSLQTFDYFWQRSGFVFVFMKMYKKILTEKSNQDYNIKFLLLLWHHNFAIQWFMIRKKKYFVWCEKCFI
jgi:hypothetical protein